MVGTIYNLRKKGILPWMPIFLSWEGNYNFRRTFFSSRQLSLSSISGLKDCLPSLRSADNCPSSLRSRKVKVLSRKKMFVFICIPSQDKSLAPGRNYYSRVGDVTYLGKGFTIVFSWVGDVFSWVVDNDVFSW